MKKLWNREVLRFVDAWACKEGTPEDEEDERKTRKRADSGGGILGEDFRGDGFGEAVEMDALNTSREEHVEEQNGEGEVDV